MASITPDQPECQENLLVGTILIQTLPTADAFVDILADALTAPPFHYPRDRAEITAEKLRPWWPSIADGDEHFAYTAEQLRDESLAAYVNAFSGRPPADNDLTIELPRR